MKRLLVALNVYLTGEMVFPYGVFLMTGAGIAPAKEFSLQVGDRVWIEIDALVLKSRVEH
jgi:2-dehydro-3-deoxy-D-arabinonate dehydratase